MYANRNQTNLKDDYAHRRVPNEEIDSWQQMRKERSWNILMMIRRELKVEEEPFIAQVSVLNGIRLAKVKEYIETFVTGGFVRREGKCLVWQGRQQKPNILSVSQTT